MKTKQAGVKTKKKKKKSRSSFSFRLVFSDATEIDRELEDALFEAGCDDALLGLCEGVLFLIFDREAPSYRVALISAIMDVERAGVGLELVRVEPI